LDAHRHFEISKTPLNNFQVINSDNAVVVNFHAEWCEPCKILTPKMTEMLEDNPDIDLAVVDVDTNIE
jgi:thiol-disulfide isomerase/thioredoxin